MVFLMLSALASGCAYMLKGTTDNMTVITDPEDAEVTVNNRNKGLSPVSFSVPSNEDLDIRLSKAGYQPKEVTSRALFRSGYEAWSFVEFVIPMVIDMSYGAAWGHDPTTITERLDPAPSLPTASSSRGSQ